MPNPIRPGTLRNALTLALTCLLAVSLVAAGASDADARKRKRSKASTAPTFGMVDIMSTNPGAQVEIDGKAMGQLPFRAPIKLSVGQHTIRVYLRGYGEFNDTFEVVPGDDNELEVDLIPEGGILMLTTTPPGATVKLKGTTLGVTPFDQVIPLGKLTLEVERPGHESKTLNIDVLPGKQYTYALDLPAVGGAVAGKDAFYETWWFWTIVGVVVAGSATTVAVLATQDDGGSTGPTPDLAPIIIP